jgi:hypothetical protein
MGIKNIQALVQDSINESHDDTDVPAALERTTDDGPGFAGNLANLEEHLPPSDFEEEQK